MNMRRRTVAGLFTVLVTVGLAGCGNNGGGGAKDAGGRPLLPSSSAGGGSTTESQAQVKMAAPADSAAAGAAASMIAPVRPIEYRLAADAKAPVRTAPAYKVVPDGGLAAADVVKALGLTAAEADNVEVSQGLAWWYGADAEEASSSASSGAVTCAAEGKGTDGSCGADAPVAPPAPPAGVPTAAEAEARLRKVLDRLGIDAGKGRIRVDDGSDLFTRTVTYTAMVDGRLANGLETVISFGGGGRIEYASGFSGRVEKLGDYPLVAADEALRRFQEGGAGVGTGAEPAVAVAPPPDSTSAAEDGGPVMTIEPQPAPAPVPLEPEVVELQGPSIVLEVVYPDCEGGDYFLVPVYSFTGGGTADEVLRVPAVEEASMRATAPAEGGSGDAVAGDAGVVCPEDQGAEGDGSDAVPQEPGGAPEPGAVAPDAGGSDGSAGNTGGGTGEPGSTDPVPPKPPAGQP